MTFSSLLLLLNPQLTDRDIQAFERIMPGRVLVADADKEAYNTGKLLLDAELAVPNPPCLMFVSSWR